LELCIKVPTHALSVVATKFSINPQLVSRIVESNVPLARETPCDQDAADLLRELVTDCAIDSDSWTIRLARRFSRGAVFAARLKPSPLRHQRDTALNATSNVHDFCDGSLPVDQYRCRQPLLSNLGLLLRT